MKDISALFTEQIYCFFVVFLSRYRRLKGDIIPFKVLKNLFIKRVIQFIYDVSVNRVGKPAQVNSL